MVSTNGRPQSRAAFRQHVDRLSDSIARSLVEPVDPLTHLVYDVDAPFLVRNAPSLVIGIHARTTNGHLSRSHAYR